MRLFGVLITALITIILILLLDRPSGSLPALGRLLNPYTGWAAGLQAEEDQERELKGLKDPVRVWLDDRMVPHILAGNNHDLYFVQGYIHAWFRLWQMEFQTHAAAGRLGELVGEKTGADPKTGENINLILQFDRGQRRKGMVFGAERSLQAIESDPRSKEVVDAYTKGVNAYINNLEVADLPLEYKLMGYKPEPWTNLKTALLLMYMADDLTGYTEDIPLTLLRDHLPKEVFERLYSDRIAGEQPVIPPGTSFDNISMPNLPQPEGDSLWSRFPDFSGMSFERSTGTGSNNWAISGAHTSSGAPILCNDPHLGLNLPALWFEMQLQAPEVNVYGVSLPGAPGIIIGFNDSIAWGLPNNYRDVKDYYEIEVIDRDFYNFDGKPKQFSRKVEEIRIKGRETFYDTVIYTLHGPVMYDASFPAWPGLRNLFAVTWMAHRSSNELLSIHLLNRSHNYIGFTEAINHFQCPAQNIVYADRAGNIAMWGQGQFVNKWRDQGRFIMKGNTSSTLWGPDIPMTENPHALNPEQGYLSSANQVTTDTSYPYWYNGYFSNFRAWAINGYLDYLPRSGYKATLNESDQPYTLPMAALQNNNYSILAQKLLPLINSGMPEKERRLLADWTAEYEADSKAAAVFHLVWVHLYQNIWMDELEQLPVRLYPNEAVTMQLLLNDSVSVFYDDLRTPGKEGLKELVELSVRQALDSLQKISGSSNIPEWQRVKNTTIRHLSRLPAFSIEGINNGGWSHTINATTRDKGPSWRMIVELGKDSIRAFGIYPGGQSGRPGHKHYSDFVDDWSQGTYYRLLFLPRDLKQAPENISVIWNLKPESQ